VAIDESSRTTGSDARHAKRPSLLDIVGRRLDAVADAGMLAALLDPTLADEDTAGALSRELWIRQELWGRSFEDLFPGLAAITETGPVTEASARTRNVLLRCRLGSWSALARITPLQLAGLPNFGRKSFAETVGMVLLSWAAHCRSAPTAPVPIDRHDERPTPQPDPPSVDSRLSEMSEVLTWLWRETGAETLADALADWPGSNPPERITAIAETILDMRIDEMLRLRAPDEFVWRTLFDLPQRDMAILRERVYPDGRAVTLAELAERLHITRERVRQLETRVREHLAAQLTDDGDCAGLVHLAARTRRAIGYIADGGAAIEAVDAAVVASSEEPPRDNLRRNVLLSLIGPHVEEDGLFISDVAARRLDDARRVVADSQPGTALPESLVGGLIEELGVPPALEGRLEGLLDVRRIGGRHVVWRGSMADKAVSVLSVTGEPMTMLALHERVGLECNPRSLAGQVQGDRRIIRRGKEHYGLRSWGGEEYTGILEELEQAIERGGGRIDLEKTVEAFVATFGVSAQSVRSYAADRRFVRNGDGSLSLRTEADPPPSPRGRPLVETRGVFLLDGVWHLRIEVDHDLLRGSGRLLATGAAVAAGLEPDLTLGFDFGAGSVTFSWSGSQPNIGSLRATALAQGCAEGDLLFLPLAGPEPRQCRVCRAVDRHGASGVIRLALEMGLDAHDLDADDPVPIAHGLGLPAGADWQDVVDRLRDRGDGELVDLIPLQLR
jgi:DNA-directed RNA polymerase specialized sigma24 family protein